MYDLRVVNNPTDLKNFHKVPELVYKNDSNYIAHIQSDIEAIFDPAKNDNFENGDATRFVIYKGTLAIGRVAVFYVTDVHGVKNGGCGFFECINDKEAARQLFFACEEWLKTRNLPFMDGPINFGGRESYWGLLIEAGSYPSYRENYNPSYYKAFFDDYGFKVEIEQSTFLLDNETFDLPRFEKLSSKVLQNHRITTEYLDYNNIEKYASDFVEIYNKGWAFHSDFKPMTKEKMYRELKSFKPVLPGYLGVFVYLDGKPAGFLISILEVNQIFKDFKGKLSLLNKLQFLLRRGGIRKIRAIVFGLIPEATHMGMDVALIMGLYHGLDKNPKINLAELSWIGDFNPKMFGMLNKLGAIKCTMHYTMRKVF